MMSCYLDINGDDRVMLEVLYFEINRLTVMNCDKRRVNFAYGGETFVEYNRKPPDIYRWRDTYPDAD